ncbi:RNA-binding protein [Paraphotobacterium marinum]|uniref:RNA-binding protein n=1 Tax=Paraphotobacterium marinum TaxID=1755811 RepID=A0A220VDM2_9GAMM|nr:ribosome assembly RNA-binding protein YhbY [Paraphotobacterium marinum]ASK78371.1 RNA-binding protein [Paraphotobacterium marinum]
MKLTSKQIKFLKSEAHHLKPIVLMGANGLTEGVIVEIESAVAFHELVKVKLVSSDKETKDLIIDAILRETHSEFVQVVGNILTLYKSSPEKKYNLPK